MKSYKTRFSISSSRWRTFQSHPKTSRTSMSSNPARRSTHYDLCHSIRRGHRKLGWLCSTWVWARSRRRRCWTSWHPRLRHGSSSPSFSWTSLPTATTLAAPSLSWLFPVFSTWSRNATSTILLSTRSFTPCWIPIFSTPSTAHASSASSTPSWALPICPLSWWQALSSVLPVSPSTHHPVPSLSLFHGSTTFLRSILSPHSWCTVYRGLRRRRIWLRQKVFLIPSTLTSKILWRPTPSTVVCGKLSNCSRITIPTLRPSPRSSLNSLQNSPTTWRISWIILTAV